MSEPQAGGDRQVTRVTVWNEFVHERRDDSVRAIYPDGMHKVVGAALERYLGDAVSVRFATLDEPEHGLGGVRARRNRRLDVVGPLCPRPGFGRRR